MTKKLREFTDLDWDGFAGATRTEQGDEPLVNYDDLTVSGWFGGGDNAVAIVVDAGGASLYGIECDGDWLRLDVAYSLATFVAEQLLSMRVVAFDDLLAMGFVE